MAQSETKAASLPLSAASAIDCIIMCDLDVIRKHLRAMMDSYLLQSEDQMEFNKREVHDSFLVMDESLKKLQVEKTVLKVA